MRLDRRTLDLLFSLQEELEEKRGCKVPIRPVPYKCPRCKKTFRETPYGFKCPSCGRGPQSHLIDIAWKGKRYRFSRDPNGVPLNNYRLAKGLSVQIEAEILAGTFDPTKYAPKDRARFLFQTLVEQYLAERRKAMRPAGYQAKESWFKHRLIPHFGEMDVREIKAYHLQEFYRALLEEGELSPSSIRKCFVELRAFLNWAKRLEYIERVPELPQAIPQEEKPIKWLSMEQQALILSHVPPEHRPIFEFGFLTGLRIGELRALMWDALDLREGYAIIHRSFSLDRLVETPKEKAPKVIPLVGRIREIIEEQARNKRSMFVFSYQDRNRWIAYPYKRLLAIWKEACRKAGINISLYAAIRHSFAMQRLRGGYSYEEVGAALGHKSPQTTRRYARLRAEMVESIFSSPTKVVSLTDYRRKKNSE
ncbi:MAG TPA: hypothetical protein ENJ40_06580 [Thermosulfurimonas dismutans]|uniref:Uncharacterized protein n=1 Tax=Thermosulfurimonas dismutans TaxID=999894 RepID=A0A7C3GVA0_9BACT|nr:hypothetical protein [Thermosulfurimonas dismutans]